MDDLVDRLCTGEHPVRLGGRDRSVAQLRSRIEEHGLVFITFTGTRGGTELMVGIDRDATRTDEADFDGGAGRVHIVGTLTLNEIPVRCEADLSLESLDGTGRLRKETPATGFAEAP